MPIVAPNRERSYSLFDADLPLLAADAASEIDLLTHEAGSLDERSLPHTLELLQRLKCIASSEVKFDMDRILYEQSLLPSLSNQGDSLLSPSETRQLVLEMLQKHDLFLKEKDSRLLERLKHFFLEVSAFASANRSMLKQSASEMPFATL